MLRRKRKVLLIQPPALRDAKPWERSRLIDEYWSEEDKVASQMGDRETEPNHGLLFVAAALRRAGYDVQLIDFHALDMSLRILGTASITVEQIRMALSNQSVHCVGISCIAPNYHWARKIADLIRAHNPGAFIFMGGIYPTFAARTVLEENPAVAAVVRGEGEIAAVEMLNCRHQGQGLEGIEGLSYRMEDGQIVENPDRALLEDIESLPYPAYDLLPGTEFPLSCRVTLARGCSYSCRFCAPAMFWRGRTRYRDASKVVDEIAYHQRRFGVDEFLIGDLTFFQGPGYEELCHQIVRRGLAIRWWCQTRAELIDAARAKLLQQAGCVQVSMGVESATVEARHAVLKENTVADVERACHLLKDNGLLTQGYFMIGLPYETAADVLATIQFMQHLIEEGLLDSTNIGVLVPFPSLCFYRHSEISRLRIVDHDLSNYYMCVSRYLNPLPVYETDYLSRYQIRALWELALATAVQAHRKAK